MAIIKGKKGKGKKTDPKWQKNTPPQGFKKKISEAGESGLSSTWERVLTFQKWIFALITGVIIMLLLSPDIQFFSQRYNVGDIALHNIKATQDLLIEDTISTEKKREEAQKSIKSIYDLDRMVLPKLEIRLRNAFFSIRKFYSSLGGVAGIEKKKREIIVKNKAKKRLKKEGNSLSQTSQLDAETFLANLKAEKEKFYENIGVTLIDREFKILEKSEFDMSFVDNIVKWVRPFFDAGLVADKELLSLDREKGIIIRDLKTKDEKILANINTLYDLKEAKEEIDKSAGSDKKMDKSLKEIALTVIQKNLRPNLTFNKSATEERAKEILAAVKPVYFQIKKGEIIVREGERVTKDDFIKLQGLFEEMNKQTVPLYGVGMLLLTLLIFTFSYRFSSENIKKFSGETKDILLMSLVLVGTIMLIEFSLFVADAFNEKFTMIPSMAYTYAIPVVAGAMIIRLFLNSETSLIFSVVLSFLSAFVLDRNLFYALYFFLGSIAGAGALKYCTQRVTIIKAGLIVGLVNVSVIFAIGIVNSAYGFKEYLIYMPFGFMGGIIAAIVVTGITPLIEHGLGYTTNIKLLELARMDHPLLKSLALQAPGTYHHCIIIGSLVEAAAEVVSANPLLAKVSAFYHDIGKMKKPMYFVENQRGENKHERLAPSMSALILISHVKEGVELARTHRLGKEIIDIIKEHHGTSIISYFYQKAKESEDPDVHEINEKDFRYPGPKPQTKEAGLVMLADAVEAACKTIPDPNPSKVQGAVHKIINKIFTDGQLDECELTLRDLNEIAIVFNRIINGIYHTRIDYPEPAYITRPQTGQSIDKDKRGNGYQSSEQTEGGKDRYKETKKGGKRSIKRLGVAKR